MQGEFWIILCVLLFLWGLTGFLLWISERRPLPEKGYITLPKPSYPRPTVHIPQRGYWESELPDYPMPKPKKPVEIKPLPNDPDGTKGVRYVKEVSLKRSKAKPKNWEECKETDCQGCKYSCGGHHDSRFIKSKYGLGMVR